MPKLFLGTHITCNIDELQKYEPDTFQSIGTSPVGYRETWERSIEELLFNDAIQRFSPGIQTKRIEKMKFTPDLYKEIEKGMAECSNWVHDQARAINNPPPKVAKLESFLSSFNEFVKKFR